MLSSGAEAIESVLVKWFVASSCPPNDGWPPSLLIAEEMPEKLTAIAQASFRFGSPVAATEFALLIEYQLDRELLWTAVSLGVEGTTLFLDKLSAGFHVLQVCVSYYFLAFVIVILPLLSIFTLVAYLVPLIHLDIDFLSLLRRQGCGTALAM